MHDANAPRLAILRPGEELKTPLAQPRIRRVNIIDRQHEGGRVLFLARRWTSRGADGLSHKPASEKRELTAAGERE